MFKYVAPDHLDGPWSELLQKIEQGLKHGQGDSYTADQLHQLIKSGKMMMWALDDLSGCMIVSVLNFPSKKVLFVELIAGRGMDRHVDGGEKALNDYKELINADTIEASCRSGLVKLLTRRGWRKKATIMELKS